ncbi:MAG: hypothetical protein HOV83_10000, partial [Catenulispora sp.]|nr:hypothetical protein [Catenulispora sp.]
MSSWKSARRAMVGGLALAASTGSLVGISGTAHAADASAAPVNGPIAYVVSDSNVPQWHNVDPSGTHDTVVPVGQMRPGARPDLAPHPAMDVVYSPDGARVLFVGVNGCEYLADADGTGALALTAVTHPNWAPCTDFGDFQAPSLAPPISGSDFTWSADSKSVYFVDTAGSVGTVSADGTKVTSHVATVPAGYRLLSASPSGALVFSSNQGLPHIAVLDPGAAAPRDLTTGTDARFSSTGRLLVRDDVFPPGRGIGVSTLLLVDPATGD